MSAERIASAMQRMRLGCVRLPVAVENRAAVEQLQAMLLHGVREDPGEVVDCTSIRDAWHRDGTRVDLYKDHMLAPPLTHANYCFYAPGLNPPAVFIVGCSSCERSDEMFDHFRWTDDQRGDEVDHALDWADVRWILALALYIFPDDQGAAVGPCTSWRVAVSADGTPLDIHWTQVSAPANDAFDDAFVVACKAITWMNCRNIELVVPQRQRSERRRLERTGISVKELHIRPVGKTYQYNERTKVGGDLTPLHTVRGHLARYGIDGRKKLFGRISGVFWIPSHARGSAENGTIDKTRVLEASDG